MAARIFVVSGDDDHRSRLIDVLSGAGYRTSGAATFIAPAAGTYVARAFPNNTYALLAESVSFTVMGGQPSP